MIRDMIIDPRYFTREEQAEIAAWLAENGATGYVSLDNIHIEDGSAVVQVLCYFDANGDRAQCDCTAQDIDCSREETITLTTPPPACVTKQVGP